MRLRLLRSTCELWHGAVEIEIAHHVSLDMPARSFKVPPCDLDPPLEVHR